MMNSPRGNRTVASVMAGIGPQMERRWRQVLAPLDLAWPPARITLLALKEEKRLEVWAARGDRWVHVRDYPIRAASGRAGPKLREGDRQVPEGVYCIESMNPNSSYHLSMKIDYPNAFDRACARRDGRTNLGGDIFIHGRAVSIGCLAMGDVAIEELFALVETTGRSRVTVIILPNDLRGGRPAARGNDVLWLDDLYRDLRREATPFGAGSGTE